MTEDTVGTREFEVMLHFSCGYPARLECICKRGEVFCRTYVRLIPHVELHFCCNSGEIVVKYACLPSCRKLDEKMDTTHKLVR